MLAYRQPPRSSLTLPKKISLSARKNGSIGRNWSANQTRKMSLLSRRLRPSTQLRNNDSVKITECSAMLMESLCRGTNCSMMDQNVLSCLSVVSVAEFSVIAHPRTKR